VHAYHSLLQGIVLNTGLTLLNPFKVFKQLLNSIRTLIQMLPSTLVMAALVGVLQETLVFGILLPLLAVMQYITPPHNDYATRTSLPLNYCVALPPIWPFRMSINSYKGYCGLM
jgi:hypothetical protein